IAVVDPEALAKDDLVWLDAYFMEHVFPVLTPLAIDPAHPFPFIPNLGFVMVLELKRPADGRVLRALVPLPGLIARFVRLPGDTTRYLPIEQLVGLFLDRLFPGFEVLGSGYFRVIRDSEIDIEE